MAEDEKPRAGNPKWYAGMPSPNPAGAGNNDKRYAQTLREILDADELEVCLTFDDGNGPQEKRISVKASEGRNLYYGVAAAQIIQALRGSVRAAKEIMDRADGRVPLPIVQDPGGGPAEKKFIKVKGRGGKDRYIEF